MPVIKAAVNGVELSFAPLKLKELRSLQTDKAPESTNLLATIDMWTPYIKASLSRGGSEMPDLEEMDVEQGGVVFAELLRGVMKALGVEGGTSGEAIPAATPIGTASTVS